MSRDAVKSPDPVISFIVITRNRSKQLLGCLRNIESQTCFASEVVVVDNGSSDGTAQLLSDEFPDVNIVRLTDNTGVSGGRNRAVREARGKICIFVDDDARFIGDDLADKVLFRFDANPNLAIVAFRVRHGSDNSLDRRAIPRADKRHIEQDYSCTYFSGAGFALKRDMIIEVGMFWERLFYGGEELDLSYRLLDRGYEILCPQSIEVLHYDVKTNREPGQWTYFNARNRCWVATRNLPWPCVISTTLLWWGRTCVVGSARGEFPHFIRGVRDALRGWSEAKRTRSPIGAQARRELRRNSGRLWY
jgi:GT2 family glycosyltransferase